MQHELKAVPGQVHWGQFDAALKPVLTIASGDIVTIDTLSAEPEDMPEPGLGFTILPGHKEVHASTWRGPGPHFMTGPISMEGAEPGDALAVEILDIKLRQDWGWNLIAPLLGTLPEDFPNLRRVHLPIDMARKTVRMPWGLDIPCAPFFGIIGVAPPAAWGRQTSIIPRAFGGNMDNKDLVAGATLYLPVFNAGGLLSVGDGHGVQGHGEVCLTAVETALTGQFRVSLIKSAKIGNPWAETPTHLMTMAFNEDLDDAAKEAVGAMIRQIGQRTGLSDEDAYMLCSLAADLHVTQLVDVNKGIHVMLPKWALKKSA